MIRILVEISLPAARIPRIRESLCAEALPEGIVGRLAATAGVGGCEGPARGGGLEWTPCSISLEAGGDDAAALEAPLRRLRDELVAALRPGGVELFCIPAFAQRGDEYLRLRDVLDVLGSAR